ncbi:MAG: GNAT family N-acetyltransferase [Nanoarchaeota archaeon]
MFKGIVRELKKQDVGEVESILGLYWSGNLKERFIKRLRDFADQTPESIEQRYRYLVAEESENVRGVVVFRNAPDSMKQYTTAMNPVELYIIAVRNKGQGVGSVLRTRGIEEMKRMGYTEAVLYSAENHRDSWNFHDNSDFRRAGQAVAPNGESGLIWRMSL